MKQIKKSILLVRNFSVSSSVGAKQLTVRDALNMALDEELARDEKVIKLNH